METWKPLYDHYEVSNMGKVRNKDNGREISTKKADFTGYCRITIKNGERYTTRTVHRVVAEAFLERPEGGTEVHHKNGDKTDNRAENLEWVNKADHAKKDKERRNGRPTKHRENFLARKKMSF